MPNIKSAKKSLNKSKIQRKYNISHRSMLRTLIKKVHVAICSNDRMKAYTAFSEMQKTIDRYSRKGLLHRNKASRYKSKIHAHIKSMSSQT